jgi:hypothetical protein
LTEARVILPGSQALLGFQLSIVLTQAFERLPPTVKLVHGAALLFVALSIILLMAPAAYHRIVYKGEDSEEFHRIGSRFVSYSTIPLALGLAADVFVVGTKIVPSEPVSAIAAVAVLAAQSPVRISEFEDCIVGEGRCFAHQSLTRSAVMVSFGPTMRLTA